MSARGFQAEDEVCPQLCVADSPGLLRLITDTGGRKQVGPQVRQSPLPGDEASTHKRPMKALVAQAPPQSSLPLPLPSSTLALPVTAPGGSRHQPGSLACSLRQHVQGLSINTFMLQLTVNYSSLN